MPRLRALFHRLDIPDELLVWRLVNTQVLVTETIITDWWQFASTTGNIRRNITCSKEVILAAGALLSPALLQVSGIGPAELLQSINVTVQVDLPGVGQNFQDHPMVGAFYNCESPVGFTRAVTNKTLHRQQLVHLHSQ
jgi:choline dehydrogenase-like flavoprotein